MGKKRSIIYCQKWSNVWSTAHTEIKPSIFLLLNVVYVHDQLNPMRNLHRKIFISHGLLLKWLDFTLKNSQNNNKCDSTFFFCIYRNWFCNLDENIATIIAFVYWLTALITLSHPHLDSRIARLHALPSLASLQGHFKDNFLHPVECSSSNSLTINSPNCFKRMSYKSHDSNRKLTQTTPLERQL